MDIYCPKCGEPWEVDTLHEQVEERWPGAGDRVDGVYPEKDYAEKLAAVRVDFYRDGCPVLGGRCSEASEAAQTRAAFSAALHDVLGDDVDGIASELEDAEALGWI